MDVFIPERQPKDAVTLTQQLISLGVRGRDAAYLASVLPPENAGAAETTAYLREFEFMVAPKARRSVATLVGFQWRCS